MYSTSWHGRKEPDATVAKRIYSLGLIHNAVKFDLDSHMIVMYRHQAFLGLIEIRATPVNLFPAITAQRSKIFFSKLRSQSALCGMSTYIREGFSDSK